MTPRVIWQIKKYVVRWFVVDVLYHALVKRKLRAWIE